MGVLEEWFDAWYQILSRDFALKEVCKSVLVPIVDFVLVQEMRRIEFFIQKYSLMRQGFTFLEQE